ncbi:hypothetical protein Dimus_027867 [Dionaea muscipula]
MFTFFLVFSVLPPLQFSGYRAPAPQRPLAIDFFERRSSLRRLEGFLLLVSLALSIVYRFVRMPRTSTTKKTGQSNSSTAANAAASNKASSKESERIDQLFYVYANRSLGLIDPEGIEKMCSDMEVDHTDVRILMLAWKMQAEKQGYFTLEEWRRGLKAMRVDTIVKLKKALPDLEKEVRRTSNFVDFYSYAFRYCLTEEKQKSIDIESICQLLDLVLGNLFRAQVDYLVEYLKIQTEYKVINMDQWMGFYRFFNEISFPDFNDYDPEHAWPLILDNFVDWMNAKKR